MNDHVGPPDRPVNGAGAPRPVRPADGSRDDAARRDAAPGRRGAGYPRARTTSGRADSAVLSPERIAEIRQKIRRGAYDSTEVIREVACRILGSGDLQR